MKAASYFLPLFEKARDLTLDISGLAIDNKENAKNVKESTTEALNCLEITCRTFKCILDFQLTPQRYNQIRTNVLTEDRKKPKKERRLKKIENSEGEGSSVVNEQLRERLQLWRSEKFKTENIPAYMILHQSTLMTIASTVPHTKEELLSVKGFGQAKFEKYGEEILSVCREFEK